MEVYMDPSALIPNPDQIPVGWGWFQFLLTLTFYLHILAMNVMLGTIIIAFVRHVCCAVESQSLTRQISKKLPYCIAIAVNFGIAPLLFTQVIYGHFIYVSSVLMGFYWLSIVALLIIAYYSAYIYMYRFATIMRAGRMVAAGVTLFSLLCIGFFISNNITMMLQPESWGRYFAHPEGFLLNLGDPTLFPRYLHFVVSSVAVGGLAIALFYTYQASSGKKGCLKWIQSGCNWFSGATFVNFLVGFWFLGSLPIGLIDTSTHIGGMFVFFLIIGIIAGVFSVFAALRYRPLSATYLLLATLLFMVLMRDFLRLAYLKPWFSPTELVVQSAWSPFILFLISFVAGIGLIIWMLRVVFAAKSTKEVQS
jgi:hypothetical protein